MGKSSSAPEYATTKYNTGGLFGDSSASKNDVNFTPTNWQTQMGNLSSNLVNNSLYNMYSNDYLNDPNFKVYKNNFDDQMQQSYDSDVLSQLSNRGLMRSSGLQSATNAFNDTLSKQTANLMDSYYNRQANNLSSALAAQNALYNYIMGINSGAMTQSKAVSGYNIDKYKAEEAANNNNGLYGEIAKSIGNIGAAAAPAITNALL